MTCAKGRVIATIVAPDGHYVSMSTNGCLNPQRVCPRGDMPTGVGYNLCKDICKQIGHAEANACYAAEESVRGCKMYLEGHYYACDACKKIAKEHGIIDIIIGAPPE